jgi:uncharacterized surface anchored protein
MLLIGLGMKYTGNGLRLLVAWMAVVGIVLALPVPASSNSSGNVLVGGFEIDGNYFEGFNNTTTATGPDGDPVDWGSAEIQGDVDHFVDLVGEPDETVFDSGSKENDLSSWADSGSASSSSNADINNVWIHDRVVGGDTYAFFAWSRAGDQGSVQWYLELNQLPDTTNGNGVSVPDRSENDVRISLVNQGNGNFVVDEVETWDADTESWVAANLSSIKGTTNDSTINIPGGSLTKELFNEFGFNLSELLPDEDCTFRGFTTFNLRSQAGLGNQSELKDYATGGIDIPPRCGDIRIEKRDPDGNLLGGATFEITPDPTPGSNAPSLEVTDNAAPDTDPTDGVIVIDPAEPGDYTITETEPPPGYIQTTDPQDVTLPEFGSVTVVFTNRLGSITWSKLDEEDQSPICCASFTISPNPLIGAPADPPLTVVDNQAPDVEPAPGVIKVEDVKTGTYTITETAPPEGYDLPDNPVRDDVVVDADHPDVTVEDSFTDPRLPSELSVKKLDADTQEPLPGAKFELYRDDGDGVTEAPDGDTLVGDCTTDDSGTCSVGNLGFGTYYWFEVSAPSGYDLPANRYSNLIVITAADAGHEFDPVTFTDPQIRSKLTIVKLDAVTRDELAGATFVIRRDDGDGEFEADEDTIVDPPGEIATDGTGKVTVDGLLFGTYWVEETAPPTGHELPDPDPAFQGPFTFGPDNAGETVTVAFEDPQTPTDLTIKKLDGTSEKPLAGATFELYLDDPADGVKDAPDGDTLIDECTTGDDGSCTITGLGFGTYYWLETEVPPGYDLPADPFSAFVEVNANNAGEPQVLNFFNPRRPGALTVLKVDDSDDAPLAGGTFDLVLDDGDGTYEADQDTVVGNCTTGDEGTCTIGDLDFGTYFWVETDAPEGYQLPENPVSDPVIINADNVDYERTPVGFRDPRVPSELSVKKVGASTGDPLAGAVFQLYSDTDPNAEAPDGDTPVGDECTTGDDGVCTVGDLDFGTYYWFEVSAPDGYDLPEDRTTDPIMIDAGNAGDELTTFVVQDPRTLSELSVLKLDATDETPLPGAVFDLVLDDGDGTYEGDQDTFVGSCITGDEGTCTVGDLDFGTYFWVETDAPIGYQLPENPVSDPITVTAQNAGTEFAKVTFKDPRVPSDLTVLKLAEDTDRPLVGGVFELYRDDGDGVGDAPDDGDELIGECTTEVDGTCTISDLDFGDYYWYETQAPEGYLLPDDRTSDIITISADNAGTAIAPFEFVDPRKPEQPTPTPTPTPSPTPSPTVTPTPAPPTSPPPSTPTPPPAQPEMPDTGLGGLSWEIALAVAALALGAVVLVGRRRIGDHG